MERYERSVRAVYPKLGLTAALPSYRVKIEFAGAFGYMLTTDDDREGGPG